MTDSYLTISDLLKILKISKPKLFRMISSGEFPKGFYLGRTPRWPAKQVSAFLADGFEQANHRRPRA
jgi:predicted DNA-binding transcriptional regulator AlpA